MKTSTRSRGNGLVIWSVIFMALSFIIPGIATLISLLIALGLRKYPERRKTEIILIVVSIVITVVLLITGFITGSWSSFIAGFNATRPK